MPMAVKKGRGNEHYQNRMKVIVLRKFERILEITPQGALSFGWAGQAVYLK